jgi:hypothetical protein
LLAGTVVAKALLLTELGLKPVENAPDPEKLASNEKALRLEVATGTGGASFLG